MEVHEQGIVLCVVICCICLIWCVTEITITAKYIARLKYSNREIIKCHNSEPNTFEGKQVTDVSYETDILRDANGYTIRSTRERGRIIEN